MGARSASVHDAQYTIFDVDGLLIDTESAYTEIFTRLFAQWGHQFTPAVKLGIMGRKMREVAQICIRTHNLPIGEEEFCELMAQQVTEMMAQSKLMPGAEEVLRAVARKGLPMAIATSSEQRTFLVKSAQHRELFSSFRLRVCGDDPELQRGKPAPDIFLLAARRLGATDPSKCLVFEDSPAGVRAALAAGMRVIWVPDPVHGFDHEGEHSELLQDPRVLCLGSLHDAISLFEQ